jgi:N6-adenosine-specific RNA methylase IME4
VIEKYRIIYADPPWTYRNINTGGSMKSGAMSKYPVMSLTEICSLPVKDIASKDSVLFLWVTCPMMEDGLTVMKAWGYEYKTKIYWRKIMSLGMGFWFRGQVEELWLGVKGKIKAFRLQVPNFIQSKVRKHSQKPEEARRIIDMINLHPRIELFAREKNVGWDVWGNEVKSDIDLFKQERR